MEPAGAFPATAIGQTACIQAVAGNRDTCQSGIGKTRKLNRSNVFSSCNFLTTRVFVHAKETIALGEVAVVSILATVISRTAIAVLVVICSYRALHAQEAAAVLRDIETKYIFGFTQGSGIGLEGEREISLDTVARIGKKDGRYYASETKAELEFTPNQFVQVEFGPFLSAHSIHGVTDIADRDQVGFGGLFGEFRLLLLDRVGPSPVAVTLAVEPEWRRIGETSGANVDNAELEVALNADAELIPQRLYLGANLLYEPEATRDPDHVGAGWEMESKGGVSGALAWRAMPSVVIGAEVWYLRHYQGAWFNTFTGDAIYLGPTLFVQIAPKVFVAAAWNAQVAGSEIDDPTATLNLAEFNRQRARLKLAVEF